MEKEKKLSVKTKMDYKGTVIGAILTSYLNLIFIKIIMEPCEKRLNKKAGKSVCKTVER